ncbi:MAG: glycoside hydrolase family 16 protein [Myxococcota bacterium]
MLPLWAGCADVTPRQPVDPAMLDDFDGAALDPELWQVADRQWGGPDSGGVRPENVALRGGKLVLTAHGDHWTAGPVGSNPDGTDRTHGRRVGGAIATRAYFGSGRFEIRMKVAPTLGVCSAAWTFSYQELYPGEPGFDGAGSYQVVNHEIDVELPGRTGARTDDPSFDHLLATSWVGVEPQEYRTTFAPVGPQDDGAFHDYAIEWHTGSADQAPRVEWFVDGDSVAVEREVVPTHTGRLWLGAWFPDGWAGEPAFAESELLVEHVRYTPFGEAGDEWVAESYPDDGWASGW